MLKIALNTAQPVEIMLQIKATISIGLPPSHGSGSDRSAPRSQGAGRLFSSVPDGTG